MLPFLKRLRPRTDRPALLFSLLPNLVLAIALVALYPVAGSSEDYLSTVAVLSSLIAAATGVGVLLGFIFGVPSRSDNLSRGMEGSSANQTFGISNNNLAQVSDWLTKILIGAGLVQLGAIPGAMRSLAEFLEPSVGGAGAQGMIVGGTIYGAVAGFVFGYLWTVLYFRIYFERTHAEAIRVARTTEIREVVQAEPLVTPEEEEQLVREEPPVVPNEKERRSSQRLAATLESSESLTLSATELRSLALRFKRLKMPNEAKSAYLSAFALDTKDPAPLNFAGVITSRDLEDYRAADELYESALKINPSYSSALYNRACNEARWHKVSPNEGHDEKALEFLRSAIGHDPKYRDLAIRDAKTPDDPFSDLSRRDEWTEIVRP